MIRIVIENLLLLLLPTLIYVAWVFLTSRGPGTQRKSLNDAPFIWLFLAGILLAVSVLVTFGTLEGGAPGQAYRPPEFRDGKIVPGHVDTKKRPKDG